MPSDYIAICNDNIRRRGEEFDDIGRLISQQLYSDRSHFVYELLQNAEDALARRFIPNRDYSVSGKVQFRLFNDRLEFRHFGAPFDEKDVKGISDVLKGTKKKNGTGISDVLRGTNEEDVFQIGKFGIGFKSVYAFTASPEIHSGDEHFVIERYIRPKAKDLNFPMGENETVFTFPFDHEDLTKEDAYNLILTKLRVLGPRVLLFLRRISEIEWCVETTGEKGQYLKETSEVEDCKIARRINVVGKNNGRDEKEKWLVFQRGVEVPDSRENNPRTIPVEIGFCLKENDQSEEVVRIEDSAVVSYFPTKEKPELGFLIQGAYNLNAERTFLVEGDDWNDTLIKETALLLGDALPCLKKLGFLTRSLLEALPIRMYQFRNSKFYPIADNVRKTLKKEDLLPADDGTFVSAQNAKLADAANLRELLNNDQLSLLFKSEVPIKWLAGTITISRAPDLHKYLRDELGVEEVSADSFSRKITEPFMKSQSDEWIIKFYGYLFGQEALWRPKTFHYIQEGILRSRPIIRLQDDNHVSPFQYDGTTPNVFFPPKEDTDFPIVKRAIANNEEAKDFLIRLGLSEPNACDETLVNVLPKYRKKDTSSITEIEHTEDIKKIYRAITFGSGAGKQNVISRAKETAFLKAVDSSGNSTYKKPCDVYRDSTDLLRYFAGMADVWFLSEEALPVAIDSSFLNGLGIETMPRRIPYIGMLPPGVRERSTSGETIKDYSLHGLDHFLHSLKSAMDFEDRKKVTLILWEYLKNNLYRNKDFFTAHYDWFFRSRKTKPFDSHMLIRLREESWIPTRKGSMEKPANINIDQLFDDFKGADTLINVLGINRSASPAAPPEEVPSEEEKKRKNAADTLGVPLEDIEFLKNNRDEIDELKKKIASTNNNPEFPKRAVINKERRSDKIRNEYRKAPKKVYITVPQSDRIPRGIDPDPMLKENYTNSDGKMVCQICNKEMAFKKPDGHYYFEAVEAFSRDYFPNEHNAQYLALCPLCAAMYKVFVKNDDNAMKNLKNDILQTDQPKVRLKLGKRDMAIQFVETHYFDMKAILEEQG